MRQTEPNKCRECGNTCNTPHRITWPDICENCCTHDDTEDGECKICNCDFRERDRKMVEEYFKNRKQ